MRFFTIKAVTSTDGTETRDMRGFDTLDEALVRFHSDMSTNINNCTSVLCMVINSAGGVHKNETWCVQADTTAKDTTVEDTTED